MSNLIKFNFLREPSSTSFTWKTFGPHVSANDFKAASRLLIDFPEKGIRKVVCRLEKVVAN